MNFNLQHRRYLIRSEQVYLKQNEHQQQQQQQQQPTSSSQIDDNDLSLIPITSPPDNPDEYPSTFS